MNEDDFIRIMLSEPQNDMHRLLYADWLEEQGKEKIANLIREVQNWTCKPATHAIHFINGTDRIIVRSFRIITIYQDQYIESFYANRRGGTGDNKYNWAWLLSLGIKHGLDID